MIFFKRERQAQLAVIFDWLAEAVGQDDLIVVEEKGRRTSYRFDFPLKPGDRPKKIKESQERAPAFLIRFFLGQPKTSEAVIWRALFQSPELAVFENRQRFADQPFKPPRWGLSAEERKAALTIARESLRLFLTERRSPEIKDLGFSLLAAIFNSITDLGVALWVGGVLRGSAVVEKESLALGIIRAALLASRDARFKPLEPDELLNVKIEITVFSDLKIRLSDDLIKRNEILPDKGYLLVKREKRGWFLPEVFNVLSFKNLKEFLVRLGTEKAGLRPEEIFDKKTEFFIFEVEDFIEGEKGEFLELVGPVARSDRGGKEVKKTALRAADWLLGRQETDGNFIPITNPLIGRASQIDWPRSLLAGWSLIEFGKITGQADCVEAGQKNFLYGQKHLWAERLIKNVNQESLDLAYLGQAALSLGRLVEARQCGSRILETVNRLNFEPILFSQIGSFLAELAKTGKDFLAPALTFAQKTQAVFEAQVQQPRSINLAVWAELANLNLKLFEVQKEESFWLAARRIIDWLLGYQLADGSFRATNDLASSFAYTRGTAKVAEVLAGALALVYSGNYKIDKTEGINYYENCLEKSFVWLAAMQYSSANSYFIPQKNLAATLGGFRHDYFNQEAWIDGAGHFLLAVSRFINYLKSPYGKRAIS